jgi:hypothetical protein
MEMPLSDAAWALESGYCLWVGAGVTRQIAGDQAVVPLWSQLTSDLESAAGLPSGGAQDFPQRLDKCMTALGDKAFRRFLRERYYTLLSADVLTQASAAMDRGELVPDKVRAVAALGQIANPIVSFNIEPLSSILLARSAGPARIAFQQPSGRPTYTWREPGGRFQRLVYHPHGLATIDTVMTTSQYDANSQTLAFGVAIHAAFANTLAIVGMSLDDEYLRRQITSFRANVGSIYWFNSQFPDALAAWANDNDVTIVRSEWRDFWKVWRDMPVDLNDQDLAAAWYLTVSEAVEEAEGGSLGNLQRSLKGTKAAENENFVKVAEYSARIGADLGEPATPTFVDGAPARAIELRLRQRMLDAGLSLPIISKSYGAV